MRPRLVQLAFVILVSLVPSSVHPQWQVNGVDVATRDDNHSNPAIISDGAAGAIIAWQNADIYVQRVDAFGVPQWTGGDVVLCAAVGLQQYPTLVADGAGGAIVVWYDHRSPAGIDIYAQRVNGSGSPLWTPDGVALCAAAGDQYSPQIISDGAGGAIVTWHDYRDGIGEIYAQRVNASGLPLWTPDGVGLCTETNIQINPAIIPDGAGGAIVAWEDFRGVSVTADIYAQRVDGSGTPLWMTNGVGLCTAGNHQFGPKLVADGAGGAIVAWRDGRSGAGYDIYAERISTSGVLQWTADGVPVCTAAQDQTTPAIAEDGAGGAILSWSDYRGGMADIYVRRVDAAGAPQWNPDGIVLSTAPFAHDQLESRIVSDGAGGAIVSWRSVSGSAYFGSDIVAQRVDAVGVPQWETDGVVLCGAKGDQFGPTVTQDAGAGAIVAWFDHRNFNWDIYAQRVTATGEIPTAVAGPARVPGLIVGEIYPNPSAASASMDIELAASSAVRVEIFDVSGRTLRVMTLRDVVGAQRIELDGRDDRGRLLASGIYFSRVTANGSTATRKMVIAR
jgi:hypothetical protein